MRISPESSPSSSRPRRRLSPPRRRLSPPRLPSPRRRGRQRRPGRRLPLPFPGRLGSPLRRPLLEDGRGPPPAHARQARQRALQLARHGPEPATTEKRRARRGVKREGAGGPRRSRRPPFSLADRTARRRGPERGARRQPPASRRGARPGGNRGPPKSRDGREDLRPARAGGERGGARRGAGALMARGRNPAASVSGPSIPPPSSRALAGDHGEHAQATPRVLDEALEKTCEEGGVLVKRGHKALRVPQPQVGGGVCLVQIEEPEVGVGRKLGGTGGGGGSRSAVGSGTGRNRDGRRRSRPSLTPRPTNHPSPPVGRTGERRRGP